MKDKVIEKIKAHGFEATILQKANTMYYSTIPSWTSVDEKLYESFDLNAVRKLTTDYMKHLDKEQGRYQY